ncbi:MAG TPA: flagellar hook-length control protein FliK [Methylophilaceae bacterium]
MIHNDIQNQLALLIKTQAPPLLDVANSAVESPEWAPGQQLPAHVIASLGNSRFQVMVEDQTLDMNLPAKTQVGDKLELVFVSGDPRPTFALLSDVTKGLPNQSTSVMLSDTSKLMGMLQQQAEAGEANPLVAQATSNTPVVPGEPPSIQQFAAALRNVISQSGLFYESHQAEWVVGERPLSSLLLEPQAQLSSILNQQKGSVATPPAADANSPAQTNSAVQANNAAAAQPAVSQLKMDAAQMVITSKDASMVAGAANDLAQPISNPVHPATTSLVQNQLDMLGNHQIVWQGQAWPGQEMEWAIEEDNRRAADAEQITTWRTRLNLKFPVLGGVTAHLALAGKGIKIDFAVEQGSSAQLLRGESPRLTQAMETSGLQVTGLTVRQDGES